MADELAGLRKAIETFPAHVIAAFRGVASVTAGRIQRRAIEILNARTRGKASRIAAFTIVDIPQQTKFLVIAEGAIDKPANLALWFEKGTRFMVARPFLRPAADAEEARWRDEMERAALTVANRLDV